MQFLAYLAVMIIGSLIAVALAPKPPKQKAPTLEDFDLPTAEEGRSIPWIFGTYKVTDPNIIWYGDLWSKQKTKNKAKTRTYGMGIQLEVCIGPVDALMALEYGGKDLGIAEVTSSQQITISKPDLFGGRDKEGGIDGKFDICFGEPTQAVNDYLAAQLGTPLSAFRDSLTIVGRRPYLVANNTYIKPLLPTVKCTKQGWADGACWYEETAEIPDIGSVSTTLLYNLNLDAITFAGVDSSSGFTVSGLDPSASLLIEKGDAALAWSAWPYDAHDYAAGRPWMNIFELTTSGGTTEYWSSTRVVTAAAAHAAAVADPITVTGYSSYTFWLADSYAADNRSSLSLKLSLISPAFVDMNPAHIIYKALTSTDQGLGEPSATIDDDSFRAAALLFYNENLGLSFQWRNEGSIREFIGEVCRHAGAVLSLDPSTGLTQIIPLRDNYDPDSLDLITEDHVIEVVEWQDASDGEAVNEVTVEYRKRDGSKGSVTWTNRASVREQGISHETMQFPGITRESLARRVAKRECLQRSSNLSKGKLKVNRHAWDKLPGAVFRFRHAPEGIAVLVVRVIDIDLGTMTDGEITISVVQDIFSLDGVVSDVGEQDSGWTAPDNDAAAATAQDVMEAPYFQLLGDLGSAETAALASTAGYVVPLIGSPTDTSIAYNAWSRVSPADYAETLPEIDFAPTATLTDALARNSYGTIALSDGIDLDLVEFDWIIVIGSGAAAELGKVASIDTTANTVTVYRAVMDTTPQEHAAGTRVWFLTGTRTDWPRDPTARSSGETVDVKAQTKTGASVLPLASATAASVTLDARQDRPYPPGYVTVNGQAFPALVEGVVNITWKHRDRLTQLMLIAQSYNVDIGPEAGVLYTGYVYDDDTNTLLLTDAGITSGPWSPSLSGSGNRRIEIEAVRDDTVVSWQRQVRAFQYIDTYALITESAELILSESGETLATET